MKTEYDIMAEKFLSDNNTKMRITFDQKEQVNDGRTLINRYKVSISRNGKRMNVLFHDSIYNTMMGIKPTEYDVLACLQKSNPGTFEDFCSEFGYNPDSIRDFNTYKAVCREWKKVERVFGDILDKLAVIQ